MKKSRTSTSKGIATDDNIAFHQAASFVSYLQATKETNILQQFYEVQNAISVVRHSADIGETVAILQRLKDGRSDKAYELLEGRLSADIVGFVASYRELAAPLRAKVGLEVLGLAKDYRTKNPFKHRSHLVNDGVADAFKVLDNKRRRAA